MGKHLPKNPPEDYRPPTKDINLKHKADKEVWREKFLERVKFGPDGQVDTQWVLKPIGETFESPASWALRTAFVRNTSLEKSLSGKSMLSIGGVPRYMWKSSWEHRPAVFRRLAQEEWVIAKMQQDLPRFQHSLDHLRNIGLVQWPVLRATTIFKHYWDKKGQPMSMSDMRRLKFLRMESKALDETEKQRRDLFELCLLNFEVGGVDRPSGKKLKKGQLKWKGETAGIRRRIARLNTLGVNGQRVFEEEWQHASDDLTAGLQESGGLGGLSEFFDSTSKRGQPEKDDGDQENIAELEEANQHLHETHDRLFASAAPQMEESQPDTPQGSLPTEEDDATSEAGSDVGLDAEAEVADPSSQTKLQRLVKAGEVEEQQALDTELAAEIQKREGVNQAEDQLEQQLEDFRDDTVAARENKPKKKKKEKKV